MKYIFLLINIVFGLAYVQAQTDSIIKKTTDSNKVAVAKKATLAKKFIAIKKDSTALSLNPLVDSLQKPTDSISLKKDSLLAVQLADSLRRDSITKAIARSKIPVIDTSSYANIQQIPFLPFGKPPVFFITKEHQPQQKDELFYMIVGTVALLGFIKTAYSKYLGNLLSQFFESSYRSKQLREQALQQTLPSLLMNILFILSGSTYAALIIYQKQWLDLPFWYTLMYSTIIFFGVYLGKYLFLVFCGWVFNIREAAAHYIFVVFLSNKMAGVILLPFTMLLAFNGGSIAEVAYTIATVLLLLLLLYRFFISMGSIRASLNINALHFFLYLCTIEVLPLLLIYKAFFKYIA